VLERDYDVLFIPDSWKFGGFRLYVLAISLAAAAAGIGNIGLVARICWVSRLLRSFLRPKKPVLPNPGLW